MSKVTLGEFEFDPVEPSDFRATIEGASKTGKSNTMAVWLEDLADSNMPTLVVERLGILSTVREIDDYMTVVGARDEPGVDLAVPMESLDVVADMVLERGLKVILSTSTYSSDDPDENAQHRAVARVLKALNDKALSRLQAGNRRKCLLMVDEVHYFAPERGAPHVDVDDDVRRSRAQLVTIATEGGNKGINFVAAFQRRAYTTKGIVSQADNYVIHRLHRTDRAEAAKELGVAEDDIANLGTGEALIYGDITDQRVVGPVDVRRRTTPDPREETFELPDRPDELSDTLASIAEDVEDVQEKREKRKSRIDELEADLERLREENDDLREKVRMVDLFEEIASGGGATDADMEEVAAEVEELRTRLDDVQAERDRLQDDVEELRETIDAKDDTIDDLETELADYRELDAIRDDVVANARSILRQFGALDFDAEDVRQELEQVQDELAEVRSERDALQDQVQDLSERTAGEPAIEPLSDYREFLNDDAVEDAVSEAKSADNVTPRYVKGILAAIIANNGPATYGEVQERLGVSTTSHISSAATALEDVKVVEKLEKNGEQAVDLNTDGLNEVRFAAKRREETEEIMSEL